jgi:hypothetical protein
MCAHGANQFCHVMDVCHAVRGWAYPYAFSPWPMVKLVAHAMHLQQGRVSEKVLK